MASNASHSASSGHTELARRYRDTRSFTLELTRTLEAEDFVVQSMPDVSPTKWHLAHTTWFFENFLLRERFAGYREFDPIFGFLFNSYYYQVGEMHRRTERGLLTRPTVHEVLAYRDHVDDHMQRLIAQRQGDADTVQLIVLGMNHEQQHQELLLTDIKHVFSCNPSNPVYRDLPSPPSGQTPELRFLDGESGVQEIGAQGSGFHYDNELPRHKVFLHPYAIANRLVTNAEFRAFIDEGGYRRPELWLSDAWKTVLQQQLQRPFYWNEDLESEFTLGGVREINPHAPVSHVSFYEADAFARWAGGRLPTEAEWETWSSDCVIEGNFVDDGLLHPVPSKGKSEKQQVFGDTWEWTMSAYSPYPGYRPSAGAIGEYNGKFMCNQMVLRGGSCVTHSSHIRSTYRNFFYPADRWQFTGIRLARDLT
ncbi:MAG: ergothioneine biosynthesis protein EgtB [Proteobacteria bacterium]|nr:ergothioneine biosynthesis protein EgtB [Pseudomonadota bacterium]